MKEWLLVFAFPTILKAHPIWDYFRGSVTKKEQFGTDKQNMASRKYESLKDENNQ